jgi:taurine dioxygenase
MDLPVLDLMPLRKLTPGKREFLASEQRRLEELLWSEFEVAQLGPTVGAEISGIDLRRELDSSVVSELRRALLAYKVLFFRDQDVSPDDHLRFGRYFGELEVHPFLPAGDAPEVIRFAKDNTTTGTENIWHSDVSFRECPAMGSVLRARALPTLGGDTVFADMYAAYEGLSEDLKVLLDGMTAVHDFTPSYGRALDKETLLEWQRALPPVEHPVVRTHPETGRKLIYVNTIFTSHVVGLPAEESERLLDYLCRQATVPEYQYRFHWAVNSIALWDNRAVQHYAPSDYWPHRRVMERVTIIGDRPY